MVLKWEGLYSWQHVCVRVCHILKPGRKWVSWLRLICCVVTMGIVSADQSWNDGTSGQIWKFGSLLKSHLEWGLFFCFFLGQFACVQSTVFFPGATPSTALCWGSINMKQSSSIVCGHISSRESSWVGTWLLTGLWDFNSGLDFNRFSPQEQSPVVMRDANTPQQPRFSHLSSC